MKKYLVGLFVSGLVVGSLDGSVAKAGELRVEQVEGCTRLQMPQSINLMNPIEPTMLACIPNLSTVVEKSQAMMSVVKDSVGKLDIGNQGSSTLDGASYNIVLGEIQTNGTVLAKHTASVPNPAKPKMKWHERTIKVPGLVWVEKTVKVPNPAKPKFREECRGPRWARVCVPIPDGFEMITKKIKEKVPGMVDKKIKEQLPIPGEFEMMDALTAQATCKYTYTFNINSLKPGGGMDCGGGKLGGIKLSFDAIAQIMNGQMPTFASLLKAVDIKTPIVKDQSEDTYEATLTDIKAKHPNASVYVSSKPFVEWGSAETVATHGVAGVVTLGSSSTQFINELRGVLQGEIIPFTSWVSTLGITELVNLFNDPAQGLEKLVGMFTNPTLEIPGAKMKLKVLNIPVKWQKCLSSGPCSPKIDKPRLGFAVIVERLQ